MSILHLIRHGQASFGADDYDNLSPKGIEQSVALGKALSQKESKFDYVIVGPHRRHIQTFEGIKKGYKFADLPDPFIDERFAENQLMEIAQHFIPQILNSNKTTNEIFHTIPKEDRHDKFLKLFHIVAKKWMNEELDLSEHNFEGFSVFRARIANTLKTIQDEMTDKSDIMVVTSGGAISGFYAEATNCSQEEIMKLNFGLKNVSISEFVVTTERFTLKAFNSSLIAQELETFI
ncbi:MAG: histidine phosphatase family protein [Candidatus Neomarinimicrobiota bacterium]|nr:histidine phosphatase family protein [Candidatus Neomarinimicrobiota bacterium]